MGILEKQVQKITAKTILDALKNGKQPSIDAVSAAIRASVTDSIGTPTMSPKKQERKKQFNIDNFNSTIKEIDFDLDIAYEELVDIVASGLRRLNLTEVSYKAQSQQLEEIIGFLDNLLFSVANADDNFFGVFDNFESLTKVDTKLTTTNAVNLAERAVSLPANNLTGTKINMSHLYNRTSWPVTVETIGNVVSNGIAPNSNFGNAFSDVTSVWRQEVITDQNTPVTIQVTIPLSGAEDQELSINRIQLIPHTGSSMKADVLYSTDGINFLRLRGGDSLTVLKRQAKEYNLDFATTRIEEIAIRLTKEVADDQRPDGTFRYSFGFMHIGFYSLGRQFQSELRSKVLTPAGLNRPIDKVSLRVNEQVIEGTDIKYFVALANTDGTPLGDWRPISPLNRTDLTSAPYTVRFGNSSRRRIYISAIDGPTLSVETFRAIDFYALPTAVQTDDDLIFGTARLYRGFGAWNRNTKKDRVLKQIKDSYISFNPGDIQQIYAVVTEEAGPEEAYQTFPGGGISDVLQTALRVTHKVDYNPATMALIPPEPADITIDQRPNYAIYRVLRFRSIMTIELEQVTLNGEIPTLLAQANPTVGLTDRPIVQDNNFPVTITYTEGTDYTVLQDSEGRATGEIARIEGGLISDGDIVQVTYSLNPDITHLTDATRDNLIYLDTLLDIDEDDRFEVTYRFVPKAPDNTIIKPSIRVTARFGDAIEGALYEEGPDYAIDTQQGTITRIPAGAIGPGPGGDIAVYIDFFYRETPNDVETFSTWVYQSNRSPVKFGFAPLGLAKSQGERLIINTNQGQTVDLTESRESPELQFGWHNIIVRSLSPDTFANSAIKKIIELKDDQNDYVFVKGGKYFDDIQSTRTPMKQVTLDFLKTAIVPTNYNNFAINDNGRVIVNFQPGTTADTYLKQVRFDPTDSEADANGYVVGFYPEDFLLEYRFRTEQELISTKLLFRALLSRISGSDGGITPKLHAYDIRVG